MEVSINRMKTSLMTEKLNSSAGNQKPKIEKQKIDFGLKFVLKNAICFKCGSNLQEKFKIYGFLRKYLDERLDVDYYLNTLVKIDRLKVVLFNYYQNLAFEFLKTPNLHNEKKLEDLDMELHRDTEKNMTELMAYFDYSKQNKELDEYDTQLLQIVKPGIN